MALTRGVVPLYHQIAQILRSQIHAKELKSKDLLPTEDEMIRTFGVSRATVRQALQLLINERLIFRLPGKGTFICPAPPASHDDWPITLTIDQIIACGYVTKFELLECKTVEANESLAKILKLPLGTFVTRIKGIRFVDNEPFFHVTLHVPSELTEKVPAEKIHERPMVVLLEENCGLRIQEVLQWSAASLAATEVARHLRLEPGDPVLLVERHFVDTNGRVVEVANDHYSTDRMRHFIRWARPAELMSTPDDLLKKPSMETSPLGSVVKR